MRCLSQFASPRVRYGSPVAAVAVAVMLRWLCAPVFGNDLRFLFLWPAVLGSAWIGGGRAGFLALGLGTASVLTEFGPADPISRPANLLGLTVFVGFGAMLCCLCEQFHLAKRRAMEETERLRLTLAGIVDAVIATDADGRVTYLNPAAEQLTGWNQDEALGRPLGQVFHVHTDDLAGTAESPVPAILATGVIVEPTRDVVIVTRDGTRREVERGAGPVPSGKDDVDGCVVVFRDTTSRKQAENAIKDSEALFRRLVEASPFGVAITSIDGSVAEANDAFLQVVGYDRDALEDNHIRWDRLTPPEWRAVDAQAQHELDEHGFCEPYEKEFLRSDGRRVPVLVGAVLPDDRLVWSGAVVAYCVDLSEQKQAEASLREADRRKDEFLAMLGHELRTPLAAMQNATHALAILSDSTNRGSLLGVLRRQTEHLARVVDDLLDVSRLASGKIRLKPEPILLGDVLDRAAEATRPIIQERRHHLTLQHHSEPVWVDGDPIRLTQIFVNLLNNAAKYTDPGGKIAASVRIEGELVVVAVRDSGVGIPPSLLGKVFDLFEQADASPERSHGGLGLGLTLVRRLVEKHGGTVEARSDGPGTGSEFVVRLPTISPPQTSTPAERNGHASRGSRRVLVVDDNRDSADTLAMVLQLLGHEVQAVHDGPSALVAVSGFRPDVVLLDIGMPGMNGFEVAKRLRDRPETAGLRLVALTGYGQEEDRRRTQEAGFDAHLVKPASPEELAPILA